MKKETRAYIRSTIQESTLSEEYLDEFLRLLDAASTDHFEKFTSLFKEDTTFLELLYKSYAGKKRALESGSAEALSEVLEEEYRILKMIESQQGTGLAGDNASDNDSAIDA